MGALLFIATYYLLTTYYLLVATYYLLLTALVPSCLLLMCLLAFFFSFSFFFLFCSALFNRVLQSLNSLFFRLFFGCKIFFFAAYAPTFH